MTEDLDHARVALAAASASTEPALRAIYVASARAILTRLRAQIDDLETLVVAHEDELRRLEAAR